MYEFSRVSQIAAGTSNSILILIQILIPKGTFLWHPVQYMDTVFEIAQKSMIFLFVKVADTKNHKLTIAWEKHGHEGRMNALN